MNLIIVSVPSSYPTGLKLCEWSLVLDFSRGFQDMQVLNIPYTSPRWVAASNLALLALNRNCNIFTIRTPLRKIQSYKGLNSTKENVIWLSVCVLTLMQFLWYSSWYVFLTPQRLGSFRCVKRPCKLCKNRQFHILLFCLWLFSHLIRI